MFHALPACLIAAASLFADLRLPTAAASVEGNSYAVTVLTNFTGSFLDVLTFQPDGRLVSASGPAGLWYETTFGPIARWGGNLADVKLSGLQVGPWLMGNGRDDHGHMYTLFGRRSP